MNTQQAPVSELGGDQRWTGPVAAARPLGAALRALREQRLQRQVDVAPHIRATKSKLSRLETGDSTPTARDVHDLLDLYDADPVTRQDVQVFLDIVRAGPQAPPRADTAPGWARRLARLTARATHATYWAGVVVPAPLRTERYARALAATGYGDAEQDVQHAFPPIRQQRMTVLLHESVLQREIGGSAVMAEQLDHLQSLTGRDRTEVRIVPEASCISAPPTGFLHLAFGAPGPDDVVCLDSSGAGVVYLSQSTAVARYRDLLPRLNMCATPFPGP